MLTRLISSFLIALLYASLVLGIAAAFAQRWAL